MEKYFCDPAIAIADDMIAEDRTMFDLLRSSAIICDQLRLCDHMETKVLRSAIETHPIIFRVLSPQRSCVRSTVYVNYAATLTWLTSLSLNMFAFGNEEFMEEVARYEYVYHRNSKDFKDKNKKANFWDKIEQKFNLSTGEAGAKFRNTRTAYGRYRIQNRCFRRFWN